MALQGYIAVPQATPKPPRIAQARVTCARRFRDA
jgi:hypothetical protein